MSMLPEGADPKVQRYFEYYNRRLQGQSVEEIAQALGYPSSTDLHRRSPTDLYGELRADGFPVCEVCGETPAPARHCKDRTSDEKLASMEVEFPDFCRRSLEALCDEGLSGPYRSARAVPRRVVFKRGFPVRLKDNRRVRVRLHPCVEGWKYRAPEVVAGTPEADQAAIAAVAVLEGMPLNPKRVPVILHLRDAFLAIAKGEIADLDEVALDNPVLKAAKSSDASDVLGLELPLCLLRHYRPDFDDVPQQDQVALLQRLCGHISDLIESARRVHDFCQRGGPGGLPKKPVKEPARCILAAELTDALSLNSRQVGEALNVPLDEDHYRLKGSNRRAQDMVRRGRELLMQAFWDDEVIYNQHLAEVRPALGRAYSLLVEVLPVEGRGTWQQRMENLGRFADEYPDLFQLIFSDEWWREYEDEPIVPDPRSRGIPGIS